MRKTILQALSALAIAALPMVGHASDKPLTVLELYTSQGCHSCPPADTYLGQLAKRDDVLGLSFHVDYWDYIGWKDPFASPEFTKRQRSYAGNLGMGYVYTPQMVVQGMAHTTGSNRGQVQRLMSDLEGAKRLDVSMTHDNGMLKIDVGGGGFKEPARILVVAYDAYHETDIRRGENAGKKLGYHNVVRALEHVGNWRGNAVSLTVSSDQVDMRGRDGCAVLIQSVANGRILGAAKVDFNNQS